VGDLRDHTPDRRIVLVGHVLPHAAESERLDRRLLLGREADDGLCNLVPETHVRHASTETQASPIED